MHGGCVQQQFLLRGVQAQALGNQLGVTGHALDVGGGRAVAVFGNLGQVHQCLAFA